MTLATLVILNPSIVTLILSHVIQNPLDPCHPEHIRVAQCKLREGSDPAQGRLREESQGRLRDETQDKLRKGSLAA